MKGIIWFACLIWMHPAIAQEPLVKEKKLGDNWEIERLEWKETIETGTVLEVINEYGQIRARGTADQTVEIVANVQKEKGDPHLIYFKDRKEDGKLVIEVVYQGDDEGTVKKNGKRRLDLTVFVPTSSLFVGKTFKELLDVRGIGDADLYSERGKVFLRNKGHAKIVTRQGDIRAVLRKLGWEKPIHLESTVGNIEVELPREAQFKAVATTRGRFSTDYSVQIETDEKDWMKTATVTFGESSDELVLKNENGAISLLRGRWSIND